MKKGDITEDAVILRRAEDADEPFLQSVYAESRRDELAAVGWSPAQEDAFCKMQYDLQRRAYRMQFPDADYYVVEFAGESIGRMIVYRSDVEIRLVDVALLAAFRGWGIGKILLLRLQDEIPGDRPLTLRVSKSNPRARDFYERHGFRIAENAELHYSMEWRKS